jgi:NADH-quinone oxidoreductase subunit M
MNNLDSSVLSLVTFIPAVGALLLLLIPRRDRDIRIFALIISLLTFCLSLYLPAYFHRAQTGFHYEVNQQWVTSPNIHYHMGLDGISLWLVLLTTFLTPLCVLISWKSIHERVKEFFILLLVLETAMIGVFLALDLFLFYFFWESTLIPMALLIGVYGHGRKIYAAVKFFLFTMIASVLMLAALLWLYAKTGSFDFVTIQNAIRGGQVPGFAEAAPWFSSSHSRLRFLFSRSTRGCLTRTWKRRPLALCCSRASCSRWAPTACCASISAYSLSSLGAMLPGS